MCELIAAEPIAEDVRFPEAGPSRPGPARKPSAPHPQTLENQKRKRTRKLHPSLPVRPSGSSHPSARPRSGASPSLPLKTAQGVSKTRSDSTKDGFGREVVFVTRKTGLGALMGRCRSLVVDEGYTSLRFHAIGAAIPQALLLLHALLDLLPYPVGDKGMWYEIKTGSVECVDEVESNEEAGRSEAGDELAWLEGLGKAEQDKPERQSRVKSTIQIDLHISPRPKATLKPAAESASTQGAGPKHPPAGLTQADSGPNATSSVTAGAKKRNRPGKKKRTQLAQKRIAERTEADGGDGDGDVGMDEEEMTNLAAGGHGGDEEEMMNASGEEEEEEEIEER